MPKVTFIIDGEPTIVEFEHGKLPYSHHGKPESFLDVAKNLHVPLEHACGGGCAGTTFPLIIPAGAANLSERQGAEAHLLATAGELTPASRLRFPALIPTDVLLH